MSRVNLIPNQTAAHGPPGPRVRSNLASPTWPWRPVSRSVMWSKKMNNKSGSFPKKIYLIPVVYLLLFAILLLFVWPKLDKLAIIAVVSVLGGGLAGVIGSFVGAIIAMQRVEKESEMKLKEYASSQALELTKLEIELRQKEGRQKQILAVAKIYREFYKALFDLYETKAWPKEIEEQGLINRYDFSEAPSENKKENQSPT